MVKSKLFEAPHPVMTVLFGSGINGNVAPIRLASSLASAKEPLTNATTFAELPSDFANWLKCGAAEGFDGQPFFKNTTTVGFSTKDLFEYLTPFEAMASNAGTGFLQNPSVSARVRATISCLSRCSLDRSYQRTHFAQAVARRAD